jgi:hypothetical protein
MGALLCTHTEESKSEKYLKLCCSSAQTGDEMKSQHETGTTLMKTNLKSLVICKRPQTVPQFCLNWG